MHCPGLRRAAASILASVSFTLPATAQPVTGASTAPYPGTITLRVDAADLDHKVLQVRQTLPVRPGPLQLYFPRWIPGTHAPTGDVTSRTTC